MKEVLIQPSTFEEVQPIWRDYLWPGRVSTIEPVNPITHEGGYDSSLMSAEHFFFKAVSGQQICGVISGIKTTENHIRVRGIYVFPQWRRKNVGQELMKAVIKKAKELECEIIWSLPRKQAYEFYISNGFEPKGEWFENEMEFGAHRYVERPL